MASYRLSALAFLGLASNAHGMAMNIRGGGDELPKPFDPHTDGILVYSEGKTGTTSLQTSAGAMMIPPCYVGGDRLAAKRLAAHIPTKAVKCHGPDCPMPFLQNRPEGSRTWIITSNRNPFAMYPSTLFQGVGHWAKEQIESVTMDYLLDQFHVKATHPLHGVPHHPAQWYKVHYYDTIGLNVTAQPFDHKKKLQHMTHTWNNRHFEILIVRLEDSHDWEGLLKPYFPKMHLLKSNEASDKYYEQKYKEFLSVVQYTDKEIDTISQSESLNHFYTKQEKEMFISRARDKASRMSNTDLYNDDLVLEDADPPPGVPEC